MNADLFNNTKPLYFAVSNLFHLIPSNNEKYVSKTVLLRKLTP